MIWSMWHADVFLMFCGDLLVIPRVFLNKLFHTENRSAVRCFPEIVDSVILSVESMFSRWVTKSIFSSCCIKPAHLVQRVPIIVQILCYLHYVQVQFYLFRDFECVLSYLSCLQKGLEGSSHCGVTYVNLHASMQVKSHAPGCCVAPV